MCFQRVLFFLLCLTSYPISADFSGFSLGVQTGQSHSEIDAEASNNVVDDYEDNAFFLRTLVGYQFSRYFALDTGYMGLYGPSFLGIGDSISLESKFISMTGYIPLSKGVFISLEYGRARWEAEIDPGIYYGDDQLNGYDYFTSVGLGMRFADHFQLSLNQFVMDSHFIDHSAYTVVFKYVL